MTLANRTAALDFLVAGSLVGRRLDTQVLANIANARRDGMRAQDLTTEGGASTTEPRLPVELGPDGNLLRDLTAKDRTEYEAGLQQALAGTARFLAVVKKYADLEAIHEDGMCPDGWCRSHYRLDHGHEPVALGRYTDLCRFCGEFRAAVALAVKPRKLGKDIGWPPAAYLEHRDRYGTGQTDFDAAVVQVAAPLMPKRKKAS